jgi:hypothetical protein
MIRGVIASSGVIQRGGPSEVSISSNISSEDMNYYLMYWDKIVIPTNNIIHVRVNNEKELIKNGILERPRIRFKEWSTSSKVDLFLVPQSIVANDLLENDKIIDWTVHQIGDHVEIADLQKKEFNSIKLDLVNCLPVPVGNVAFEDILKFKEKRIDEFGELRSTLDTLYFDILGSQDSDLQIKKNVDALKTAIENLNKSSKEKFKISTKYDFSVQINPSGTDFGNALALGAFVDVFSGTELFKYVLGGLSIFRIKAEMSTSVKSAENKLKLSYLAKATNKNLI